MLPLLNIFALYIVRSGETVVGRQKLSFQNKKQTRKTNRKFEEGNCKRRGKRNLKIKLACVYVCVGVCVCVWGGGVCSLFPHKPKLLRI